MEERPGRLHRLRDEVSGVVEPDSVEAVLRQMEYDMEYYKARGKSAHAEALAFIAYHDAIRKEYEEIKKSVSKKEGE